MPGRKVASGSQLQGWGHCCCMPGSIRGYQKLQEASIFPSVSICGVQALPGEGFPSCWSPLRTVGLPTLQFWTFSLQNCKEGMLLTLNLDTIWMYLLSNRKSEENLGPITFVLSSCGKGTKCPSWEIVCWACSFSKVSSVMLSSSLPFFFFVLWKS